MKNYKYYYLYQIINLVNGKKYVGVHRTNDLNDGYMGSGTVLKRAQKKYGIENFEKEILEYFENETDMFQRETEVVDADFILREDTYNIYAGGRGFSGDGARRAKEKLMHLYETNLDFRKAWQEAHRAGLAKLKGSHWMKTQKTLRKLQIGPFHDPRVRAEMAKRSLSPEARAKRKNTMKENKHSQGEKNSQFGTMWITDGVKNEKIGSEDAVPDGWRKGRVLSLERAQREKKLREEKRQEQERRSKLALMYKSLKDENGWSFRELWEYLKEQESYSYTQEALRLFVNKHAPVA